MPEPCLVTIIITSFNYGEFLGQAINSALNQHYPYIEVVVVDDGSTDKSAEVIRGYGSRITSVLKSNGGQGSAANAGFASCHGDIVIFLDSDDTLAPDCVTEVVAAWKEGTSKVQYQLEVVDAGGASLGYVFPTDPLPDRDFMRLIETFGFYSSPPTSGNALGRSLIERVFPLDERKWRGSIDTIMTTLAPLYGPVISIHRPLGSYRIHDRNMSEHGRVTLPRLRRTMQDQINSEAELVARAVAMGRPLRLPLVQRIPRHCKARLLSLRLDPASHPFADDRVWRLAWLGVTAAWRWPLGNPFKRAFSMAAFAAMPLVPVGLLARMVEVIMIRDKRSRALRRVLG